MSEADARHPAVDSYARHVNPAFVKLLGVFGYGRVFTRAEDVWMWDDQERRYLDFLAGFGATNLGHNHPRLNTRVRELLERSVPHLVHTGPAIQEAELAEALAAAVPDPLEVCMFASGGAEAVEAGMKLARAVTGRRGFVHCAGGFHGTSLGTLTVMGSSRMRAPFEPLLEGNVEIPFGDLEAIDRALSGKSCAAFVVEPIQAEAGVVLPPEGYLKEAAELCRRYGTLLVLDEVQTGLGRTGTLFALEQEGVVPDVLVLGKSLGAGMTPMSAAITSAELHRKAYGAMDRFDLHSSTYEGNALGCVVAGEALAVLDEEGLVSAAAARGAELVELLRDRVGSHPLVREVRGRGLLVGVELGPTEEGWVNRAFPGLVEAVSKQVFGQWAACRLLEEGLICQPASQCWNVLKLEPPLTVTGDHLEQAADTLARVLSEYRGITPILKHASGRVGSQAMKGWRF